MVSIAEIAARLGINVARPLCKPLVWQPSSCHSLRKWTINEPYSWRVIVDFELQYDQASAVLPVMQ
jgi:hypothetical protein